MLNIYRLVHAAVLIESDYGRIYFDPFDLKSNPKDADYIFVSHGHYDHFSPADIKKISHSATVFVAPDAVLSAAEDRKLRFGKQIGVQPGKSYQTERFSFLTVPAYNINKQYHPRQNNGVGYLLRLGEETVYFAGDTDLTDEMRQIKCTVALLPIGGTYTMDAQEAARAANFLKPREVIPLHYGHLDSTAGTEAAVQFAALLETDIKCSLV